MIIQHFSSEIHCRTHHLNGFSTLKECSPSLCLKNSFFRHVSVWTTITGSLRQRRWCLCIFLFFSDDCTWVRELCIDYESYFNALLDQLKDWRCSFVVLIREHKMLSTNRSSSGSLLSLELIQFSAVPRFTVCLTSSSTDFYIEYIYISVFLELLSWDKFPLCPV